MLSLIDTFPDLIANNTVTADWQFVRITANHYDNGPVIPFNFISTSFSVNKHKNAIERSPMSPARPFVVTSLIPLRLPKLELPLSRQAQQSDLKQIIPWGTLV